MSAIRVAPHNLEAEEALIGAALLRGDLLGDARRIVDPADFYKPIHKAVWATMLDLYEHGQPIDEITVSAACHDVTANILAALTAATPSTTAWRMYADAVIETSRRRRLIGHLAEIVNDAYGQADVDELVARADASAADRLIAARSASLDGFFDVTDFMAVAEAEAQLRPWLVPGLFRPMWRMILVAKEGSGKGPHSVVTPLLTVNRGWIELGDAKVGDVVFDENGRQCNITHVHPVIHDAECFRITFSDGTQFITDAEHGWATVDYKARQPSSKNRMVAENRTTAEIASTIKARDGHCANHAIPVAGPLDYERRPHVIDPYLLGLWLGDGHTKAAKVTKPDPEVPQAFADAGWEVKQAGLSGGGCPVWRVGKNADGVAFQTALRRIGVFGDKHIPDEYLTDDIFNRLALLQGIMDTDGHIVDGSNTGGRRGAAGCEITLTCERLINNVLELILGLGIKATLRESRASLNGRDMGPRWRIWFQTDLPVFRIPRKACRLQPLRTNRAKLRYIISVEPCESVPVRCITVDSPNNLFLIGRTLVPTHNTMMRQVALHVAAGRDPFDPNAFIEPRRILYADFENPMSTIRHQLQIVNRSPTVDLVDEARGMLSIWHHEGGIDLRRRRDAAMFEAAIQQARPEIVFAGPLYKMFRRAKADDMEQATIEVLELLDDLRTRYGFAIMLEHHAPKAQGGHREMNPFGSSALLRWPDFGFTLEEVGESSMTDPRVRCELGRFRRDREPANWPDEVSRGDPMSVLAWTGRWARGR
jgi:replicative DNA helicase